MADQTDHSMVSLLRVSPSRSSSPSAKNTASALSRFKHPFSALSYSIKAWWSSPGWRTALRGIGLNLLTFAGFYGPEEPKVILDESFRKALARCSVHIIPVLAELLLVWVNLHGVLYGTATPFNLGIMQVAAKTMELLVVGSLATVVYHVLRSKLMHPPGLPFGFLGAGINFTQINWFWSPSFFFSLGRSWDQIFVTLVLLTCGVLALAMGPATAVLLVPNLLNDWPGGGTLFWLNGTTHDHWPQHLTFDNVGSWATCYQSPSAYDLSGNFGPNQGCVWEGYPLLKNSFQFHSMAQTTNVDIADFLGALSLRGQVRGSPNAGWTNGEACETFVYAPHLVESTLSDYLEHVWYMAANTGYNLGNMFLRYAYPYTTYVKTNISAVRTRCEIQAVNDINASYHFLFPVLPQYEYFNWTYWDWEGRLVGSDVNGSHSLSQWISLTEARTTSDKPEEMRPSAAVLITLASYSRYNKKSTLYVLPCSVDARWAEGYNIREVTLAGPQPHYGQPLRTHNRGGCLNPFAPAQDGSWKHISMDQTFLDWLTPSLDGGPSSNQRLLRTTLADLMEHSAEPGTGADYPEVSDWNARPAELVLAHFFAEALSRIGQGGNENLWADLGSPNSSLPKPRAEILANGSIFDGKPAFKDMVESSWQIQNTGYALKARSVTEYLAIIVVCVHIAIAAMHTIYVLWTCKTSHCWDGTEELLALAWNSEPSRGAPRNTCGGINDRRTLSSKVRIRVIKPTPGQGTENVQLVAADDDPGRHVQPNVAYGATSRVSH